jgi:hypothetical protein
MKPFCLPLPFRPRATYHNVLRARIVLAAARGKPNAAIDAGLLIHVDTVHNWRKRYATGGLEGLKDLTRTGRRTFTPVQVAGIKALACTPPQQKDVSMANSLCPRAASRNALWWPRKHDAVRAEAALKRAAVGRSFFRASTGPDMTKATATSRRIAKLGE